MLLVLLVPPGMDLQALRQVREVFLGAGCGKVKPGRRFWFELSSQQRVTEADGAKQGGRRALVAVGGKERTGKGS